MYTLEDDHETPSRLNKPNLAAATPQGEALDQTGVIDLPEELQVGMGEAEAKVSGALDAPNRDAEGTREEGGGIAGGMHDISTQITSSFKQITTPGKGGAVSQRAALAALTIACIGVFLTALDQTVVVTALPQIITTLQIPIMQLDHASWIVSAYLLGFIVAMPLMGRVSDIYGRRRIFMLCLVIFGIGSIFCGIAPFLGNSVDLGFLGVFDAIHMHIDTSSPGLVWLIAARLFQAIGGGAVVPVAMAIAGDFYGKERRGLALGIIGAMTEAGGALGPLYGAIIVEHLGWQYIFYLNVPLVVALVVAAWILIPRGKRLHEGIDWLGAVLLGIALTCLSLGLAQQGTSLGPVAPNAPTPQNNPIALGLALIFLVAFVLVERRVRWPVVELSLFKRLPFSATSLVSLFVGAALIIAMADIPIFVDTVLQRPVLDSGLALLRLTAMIPIGALLGGWLCSYITCRFTAVLGLLFTAAGFFLMSRWPIQVDWTQITISTMTAGLGFGLVIAPIGTTAINAVKARQAGMSSAVVTALRMVGMTLGLAALTSWALAYFKELASRYPSLPLNASSDQFATWSQGYAEHLIRSAHTVYSAVFFTSMVLCLIAIIPALFLWGSKQPVQDLEPDPETPSTLMYEAATLAIPEVPGAASENATGSSDQPPAPPSSDDGDKDGTGGNSPGRRKLTRRRRIIAIVSIALVILLIAGGVSAAVMFQGDDSGDGTTPGNPLQGITPGNAATATAISGPRMIQLALDKGALTSIFVTQLNLQSGTLTDLNVTPVPNDGLILSLNLHIDANGIHRVMPIELDGVIGVDQQQNLSLQVTRLKRDGVDGGAGAAASMQGPVNQLLANSVMPALRGQLKGVKLISAHTSTSIACGKGTEMLVLLIQAPPIEGIAAQPTPIPFCFIGPIDLNKLLPH